MANNFSIDEARKILAQKTGIPARELIHWEISRNGDFTQHHFYRDTDRTIIYTVLSQEEVDYCEETSLIDYAP